MKKELIIVIFILVIIFFVDFITQKYTKTNIESIINDLNDLKNIIIEDESDIEKAKEKIYEIEESWLKKVNVLSYYIEHDELEKVSSKINEIIGNIEAENSSQGVQDIQDCIFILNHIINKYKLYLKNVF